MRYKHYKQEEYSRRESVCILNIEECVDVSERLDDVDSSETDINTTVRALNVLEHLDVSISPADISACHRVERKNEDLDRPPVSFFPARVKMQDILSKCCMIVRPQETSRLMKISEQCGKRHFVTTNTFHMRRENSLPPAGQA